MNIGIYDPYLDDGGGGEKYMMTIASCLSKEHEVRVFWNNKENFEMLKQRFGLELSRVTLTKNIFAPDFGFIPRLLISKQYDVIIFLSDGSIPLLLSKKLFIHIQQPLIRFQNKSLLDKVKLSQVNGFFCNSVFTRSFINKNFHLKTSVIYPPIALHPKKVKKEQVILHVGRFRVKNAQVGDYKKQGAMIEVFKQLVKKGLRDWKFVLAVSVQEKDKKEFEEMKLRTKGFPVEFYVNQTNAALWDLYSKASIYWHASGFGEDLQKHPEYAEHFGISTVEAMGAGCVPVVINAGGQKEIVEEGITGFLWNTEEECITKTKKVIENKKLFEQLSAAAKKRAEDFSEERFGENIKQLIAKTLSP